MLSTDLNLKQLLIDSVATLGRQVGAGALQIITLIVIARVYGAEINGVYSIAILLPTTLAVTAFPFVLALNIISSIFQELQRFGEYNFLALIAPFITFFCSISVGVRGETI